jgi:hypothetical protein
MPRMPYATPRTKGITPGPGRPRVHDEAWVKVSVVLFARQVSRLDRVSRKCRQRGHKSMTRAGLIRGMIDAILNSDIDLSEHASEVDLRDHIIKRMGRARTL